MHHPRYRPSNLIDYSAGLFAAAGCDGDKPAAIATALVEADLLGNTTRGLNRLPRTSARVHVKVFWGAFTPNRGEVLGDW